MALNFVCRRDDLLPALSALQHVVGKKEQMAVLSYVRIVGEKDTLDLLGGDMEIGLRLHVAAEIRDGGSILLPARKLFELVRESGSEEIEFQEQDNHWMQIRASRSNYRLSGYPVEDYPELPEYDRSRSLALAGEALARLAEKTGFSIASDKESVFTMTGALLEPVEGGGLRMVTSDGHRLTVMETSLEEGVLETAGEEEQIILPRKGVHELRKFCEHRERIRFVVDGKLAVAEDGEDFLLVRLLKGKFPNYRLALDALKRDNVIQVDRKHLLEALKRISLFTEDLFQAIKMEINPDGLRISSQNMDFGSAQEELPLEYQGEPLEVAFNCRYLLEPLQVMEGEQVDLAIDSNESPCCITSAKDEGFLAVIMPMKL